MTPAARATLLARHELIRVIGTLNGGTGWRMHTASAYTAHALYQYGEMIGHVIGASTGWCWALQETPQVVGEQHRADGPLDACLSARRAVRSALGRRGRMRTGG